jgi:hypothetical protein
VTTTGRDHRPARHSAEDRDPDTPTIIPNLVKTGASGITPHRSRHSRRTWRVRPVVVVILAVVTVLAVSGILLVLSDHKASNSASPPAHAANGVSPGVGKPAESASSPSAGDGAVNVEAQVLAWAKANLSPQSVIATDDATLIALKNAGFISATTFDTGARLAPATVDYLLSMPGVTASPEQSALIAMSLPLAIWGSGANTATMRQIFVAGAATAQTDQAKDGALRHTGGAQLGQNPGITADVTAQAALLAGNLDLRAQNVCAVLATSGHIFLSVNALDPAEQRAGLPIRSITVTASNASSMQVVLAALTPPFVPKITAIAPGKVTLTWPPQVAPVAIVGG